MRIIGISGSLRQASLNTHLLNAAATYLSDNDHFELLSVNLPLYNEDLEGSLMPKLVTDFRQKIDKADGILMASPEYNHSFTGVIKNAIDWASRPAFESPLKGKPIALLTAAMSPIGGVRAQAQLRPVLASMLSEVYPGIEFSIGNAQNTFSETGRLVDEIAQRRLQRFVEGYLSWIKNGAI